MIFIFFFRALELIELLMINQFNRKVKVCLEYKNNDL